MQLNCDKNYTESESHHNKHQNWVEITKKDFDCKIAWAAESLKDIERGRNDIIDYKKQMNNSLLFLSQDYTGQLIDIDKRLRSQEKDALNYTESVKQMHESVDGVLAFKQDMLK